MLEIKKQAVSLEAEEIMELERIITDHDTESAYIFLKKFIYNRLSTSQQSKLKCHLDGESDPASGFKERNK